MTRHASGEGKSDKPSMPPEAWEPLLRLAKLATQPLERFFKIEAASGILLFAVAAAALVWANSPWAPSYSALWEATVGFRLGEFSFERPLHWIVNDGLMTIFFFVAGMEIRRELHDGELSQKQRAMLPLVAAVGGMVAPAGIYLCLADGPWTRSGWGVPMATDIAFAVGVLAILGKRVPVSLRLLLLTLAVIDDLGAIVVIAVFYTSNFLWSGLGLAAVGVGAIVVMRWLGVRRNLAYVAPAIVVWAGVYASGVHPTIAGVIIGFLTPVRAWLGTAGFRNDVAMEIELLSEQRSQPNASHEIAETLRRIDVARREAISPSEYLIERLHPWVAFGIMPLFALANAGVEIDTSRFEPTSTTTALAIALGLVVGKPVGIVAASGLAIRLGAAQMPRGLTFRHIAVLGIIAGIGFTMSLFIAQLAFAGSPILETAKLGVLGASAVATILGLAMGRCLLRPAAIQDTPRTADEAECWERKAEQR